MAPRPTRADTWRITLVVDGRDWGVWDKKDGGKHDSETFTYPPGGMAEEIDMGGRKTNDVLTLRRYYDLDRDHAHVQLLLDGRGKAACVVKEQPLDANKHAYGKPKVTRGTLKSVTTPTIDNESSSAAMLEVEITPAGESVVV